MNPFSSSFGEDDDPFASPKDANFQNNRVSASLLPPPKASKRKTKHAERQEKRNSSQRPSVRKTASNPASTVSNPFDVFDPIPTTTEQSKQLFKSVNDTVPDDRQSTTASGWESFLPESNDSSEPEEQGFKSSRSSGPVTNVSPPSEGSSDDSEVQRKLSEVDDMIAQHEASIRKLQKKRNKILAKHGMNESESVRSNNSRVIDASGLERLSNLNDDSESTKGTETVNALEFMQKGTAMLKYGRRGYPHFRHFELSQDRDEIRWYSGNKKLSKTRIPLRNVLDVTQGQKTDIFKRHAQPRLAKCSFSVTYVQDGSSASHTLDVVTKNRMDFIVWTAGLEQLVAAVKKRRFTPTHTIPTEILVQIPKRNEAAIEKRLSLQPEPPSKTVERDLKATKKKFFDLMQLTRHPKICAHEEIDHTLRQVADLEEIVENASGAFRDGRFSVAAHELWRANVEIQTMLDKLHILKRSRAL